VSNVTHFLAAQSSSRSLVVCLSVARETFVKTFAKKVEYQMVTKPYLHSYLSYSSDNSDSSDSSDSSDQKTCFTNNFFLQTCVTKKLFSILIFFTN